MTSPEILLPHDVERVYRERYNRCYIYVVDGETYMPSENGAHPTFVLVTREGSVDLVSYGLQPPRPSKKGKK